MRQSWPVFLLLIGVLSGGALLLPGCNDRRPAAVSGGIVSLTPAGTDLLMAMGLSSRIVGVSSYEANDAMRRALPKVGDYLRVDWERIISLRPAFMLVQGKRYRLPAGMGERCKELGIRTIIVQIDRLADIDEAVLQIGEATGTSASARKVVDDFATRRAALESAAPKPPVPAMVVFSDNGRQVVGRDNFINDVMRLAGGENVVQGAGYLTLDREKLASLRPKVVFLILVGADAAVVERGKAALAAAGLPKDAIIVPITEPDALMPGTSAYRLADAMSARLKALP